MAVTCLIKVEFHTLFTPDYLSPNAHFNHFNKFIKVINSEVKGLTVLVEHPVPANSSGEMTFDAKLKYDPDTELEREFHVQDRYKYMLVYLEDKLRKAETGDWKLTFINHLEDSFV